MASVDRGFTLLEVLVALTILSAVAITVLRLVGDNLTGIGDSGWNDRAALLGRNQLLKLETSGLKNDSSGNFGPEYPEIAWRLTIKSLGEGAGRRLELTVSEGARELALERILLP